jgi:hypothetical protein
MSYSPATAAANPDSYAAAKLNVMGIFIKIKN